MISRPEEAQAAVVAYFQHKADTSPDVRSTWALIGAPVVTDVVEAPQWWRVYYCGAPGLPEWGDPVLPNTIPLAVDKRTGLTRPE